jgi:hypothetical protein
MTIWRNGNYTKRNYDCTNVVCCVTEDNNFPTASGKPIPGIWNKDNMFDISILTPLYAIGNAHFHGYM